MNVLGRSPAVHAVSSRLAPLSNAEDVGGATRYARPWRPVKPLLMMFDVGMRSARHLWQRRWEVGALEKKPVGCGGEDEGVLAGDMVEFELRRRKDMLGRR